MTDRSSADSSSVVEAAEPRGKRMWKAFVILIVAGLAAAAVGALVMSQLRGPHRDAPPASQAGGVAAPPMATEPGSASGRGSQGAPTPSPAAATTAAPNEEEPTTGELLPGRILLGLGVLVIVIAPAVIVASGLTSRARAPVDELKDGALAEAQEHEPVDDQDTIAPPRPDHDGHADR